MTTSTPDRSAYQVVLLAGGADPGIEGATVVDLVPAEPTAAAVLDRLRVSELTPGDLRAKTMVVAGDDHVAATLVYAAASGFAGRRLDVFAGGQVIDGGRIDEMARKIDDAGKPASVPAQVQVGAEHPQLRSVLFGAELTAEDASLLRHARRVRLVPSGGVVVTLTQFLVVAGLRFKHGTDRWPFLCDGSEGFDPDDSLAVAGICLDTLRRDALAVRRETRSGDRDAIAEVVEPSVRATRLQSAADLDIAEVMARLGGLQNTESELWHCPRPDRHTNGDRNPSMKAIGTRTRCYRCDPERVDSLRLAMDVLDLTADEAADWLLDPARPVRTVTR